VFGLILRGGFDIDEGIVEEEASHLADYRNSKIKAAFLNRGAG